MVSDSRKIALGAIFGVLILCVNGFVPAPTSDFLIIFQAVFLAMSYLVVGRGGATYTGVVSGLLITAVKIAFFPYDLVFATAFGVFVDVSGEALKVKVDGRARAPRLVAAMTVSTGVVGFLAYYVTAVLTNAVPNQLLLDATVLLFGTLSGAMAGAIAARVWNRNLMSRFYGR